MRKVLPVLLTAAALGAPAAAAPTPMYTVTFAGSGSERQLDQLQNIQDSGLCDSAERVDVTASMTWTANWRGVRPTGSDSLPGGPARIDGSAVAGSDVKDACGLDSSLAPPGWVSRSTCSAPLVTAAAPQLSARRTATALVLSLAAPAFAVPVGAGCSLNIRNDQLTAHVAVPLRKLAALRRGRSLSVQAGTAHPGPGDRYVGALDCSQPTKPYEGYRTADRCQDQVAWSGTVRITRVG